MLRVLIGASFWQGGQDPPVTPTQQLMLFPPCWMQTKRHWCAYYVCMMCNPKKLSPFYNNCRLVAGPLSLLACY